MKSTKQLFLTLLTLAAFLVNSWAQTADPNAQAPKTKHRVAATTAQPAVTPADVQALKDALAAQQQQIQQLTLQLQQMQQASQRTQAAAVEAVHQAAAVQVQASRQQEAMNVLQGDVAGLRNVSEEPGGGAVLKNAVLTQQDSMQASGAEPTQVFNSQMESPITIRFRGINITPGGYSEAAFVRRSRALAADLPTPFNSLTMPGASQSQLSEFFGSGRQSKITTFVEGRLGHADLSSYVSADFLSAGVTSTSTQTDGYTLRLRQAWAQVRFDNGLSFLGGQTWSLVTEDAKGIAPDDDMGKTNDVRPKTIDPSYNVGFDFARQYGIRVTKNLGNKVAVAVALENPQATLTTHGNAGVLNTANNTTYYNFLVGEAGASNSYNTTGTYSFNPAPDFIAKIAFDPGFGHYEIYGMLDRFTGRVFPCVENYTSAACNPSGSSTPEPNALLAHNASKEGGGFGASARWNFANKRLSFGLKGFGGSGVGRYAPGGLPDASINPDGTLHLVKNLHGLGTLEWHGKKLDLYSYGGVEYAARTWAYDPTILPGATAAVGYVGYGAPGFNNSGCYTEVAPGSGGFNPGGLSKCTGDTRALIEGTAGFWYRFYSGPRGRFQYGTQFSYVTRNTWSGNGGQPNGLDSMLFTSFRYYLP